MFQSANNRRHPRIGQLLFLCFAFTPMSGFATGSGNELELVLDGEAYRVEVASTWEQRRQGLMFRRELGRREGMLLVYPQSGDHRIWMKNMLISLRVYWVDEQLQVIGMRRMEPCTSEPCPVYAIEQASRYVLELSDHDHPLAVGDRLTGIEID